MGRYAGWITLEAAIAGGADVALLPEIPYDIDKVVEKIKARQKAGKNFSVVVVSEGAFPKGGSISVKNTREGGKGVINIQLGGAGDLVAQELENLAICKEEEHQHQQIEYYLQNMVQKLWN